MPVRFRCVYCNQLLGIARRKAGTVVKCPTCAGQIVVPNGDPEGSADEPESPQPLVFERSDFGKIFETPAAINDVPEANVPTDPRPISPKHLVSAPAPAPRPAAAGNVAQSPFSIEAMTRPPGILLSPGKATLITVLVIAALAVAFGAGLLIGRFVLAGEPFSRDALAERALR